MFITRERKKICLANQVRGVAINDPPNMVLLGGGGGQTPVENR